MFSTLTQPHFPNAALGIEEDRLTAISLQGGRGTYSVKQAATIDLAQGLGAFGFLDVEGPGGGVGREG